MKGFTNENIKFDVLRQRAYNMRWAEQDADVIPLTAADHDFPCAPEVVQALEDYIKEGYFTYTPHRGFPSFKQAIAKAMKERKNEDVNPDFVLPIDSAARGMKVIADAVLQPGDEVIVFDPVDFLFRTSMESAGAKVILFPTNLQSDCVSLEGLEDYITPKTKMLGFCNPHNPMGMLYKKEDLDYLLRLSEKYGFYIMNDEIWSDIVYSERPFVSINSLGPELNKKTISFYGFSKGFALPGLRAGYLYTLNAEAFETALHRCYDLAAGVDYLTQIAMKTAVTDCWYWVDAFVERLQSNRDYLVERMNAMPLLHAPKPEATFVSFFDVRETGMASQAFADYAKEQLKVALVPGTVKWFGPGGEGNVRLCYSTSHAILKEALDRIEAGMQDLAGKI